MARALNVTKGQRRALNTVMLDFEGSIEPVEGTTVYQQLAEKMGIGYTQAALHARALMKVKLLDCTKDGQLITRLWVSELGKQFLVQVQEAVQPQEAVVAHPKVRTGCSAADMMRRPLAGSVPV